MIWKALSDPTRRSILEILKAAPRTTGEISNEFTSLSRFAIMKHLGILEKANLITTRKEGKFRWNYLNAMPIQQAYDKWVNNLIQLKYFTDQTSRDMAKTNKIITTTTLEVVTTIRAKKTRVWRAMTTEIGKWWHEDFYTSPDTIRFVLETKLGGLMFEDTGKKEGVVWASVIGMDSPNSILLKGNLSTAFGGPAISFLKISLEDSGKSTQLHLTDTVLGAVSETLQQRLQTNWNQLFGRLLKDYVEGLGIGT